MIALLSLIAGALVTIGIQISRLCEAKNKEVMNKIEQNAVIHNKIVTKNGRYDIN